MNKNQLIGAFIITLGVFGYMKLFGPKLHPKATDPKPSLEKPQTHSYPNLASNVSANTAFPPVKFGIFEKLLTKKDGKNIFVENENLKIELSSKGATIKKVYIKKYKDEKGNPLNILNSQSSNMSYIFGYNDMTISTNDLLFELEQKENKIIFEAKITDDAYIRKTYRISPKKYQISEEVEFVGTKSYVKDGKIRYIWNNNLVPLEKDIIKSREKATISYFEESGKYRSLSIKKSDIVEEKVTKPINWISYKQRFFTSAIIFDKPQSNILLKTTPETERNDILKKGKILVKYDVDDSDRLIIKNSYFFGPNAHSVLKNTAKGFTNNLYLGWPIVRWINQFFTTPIFELLKKYISNAGIIIILLVILIKLILFPLSYKSQISLTKMKLVKPDLDELKKKYKDDPRKLQFEQMNLYKQKGINPLGGCLPILLQMPMFIAMFNFFPNAIEIRQASFLWAKDLSTYDSILTLPFTIPIYGNHVSLFTLLMTISTILTTWSNNKISGGSTSDNNMKMFSYMMPIMFMFILNSFPAALSLYYFTSNIFTFIQQFVLKKFIDENKIRAELSQSQKNYQKTVPSSRSQNRMENKKKRK